MLRSLKYGLYGAVLAGLVAVPVVWLTVDKSVHLMVDGHETTVRTTASDVGTLLAQEGYSVDSHDIVAPASSASLHDGMQVVLRRGRLLNLDVNGDDRSVWTTAPTVQVALAQLGYTERDFVSVSRSQRLPLSPSAVTIRTPHEVTIVNDGTRQQVSTTEPTVGALLNNMGFPLNPHDRVKPDLSTSLDALGAKSRIVVKRYEKKRVVRTKMLGYATKHVQDDQMVKGDTEVSQHGRQGMEKTTYSVIYLDGKPVARTKLGTHVVREPRAKIVKVGTKEPILATGPNPSPGSAQAIAHQMLLDRGWDDSEFSCLVILWDHESGWRVNAANPSGAYGIPQALPGSKMASAGPDWQTDATTQITWGLEYISERYGTPCNAWTQWQANGGWY